MNKSPIFRQLLIKVILPVIAVFIAMAYHSISNQVGNYINIQQEKSKVIAENIANIMESQDNDLFLIDKVLLDERIEKKSEYIVNELLVGIDNLDNINLDSIASLAKLEEGVEFIYIINREGVVVNTTFEKDLGLKMFEFGDEFKEKLLEIFREVVFVTDKASPESATGRLKKFSYQTTENEKYIVQLGFYSNEADRIIRRTNEKLNNITAKEKDIISIDLFIGDSEHAVPFNNPDAVIKEEHKKIYEEVLSFKRSITRDPDSEPDWTDAIAKIEIEDGKKVHYLYSYMPRENSELYKDSVIRIKTDRSELDDLIEEEIWDYGKIFGLIIICLVIIILFVTRSITKPLNLLVDKVNKISAGQLNERADETGSKEILTLAKHFNKMLDDLEESYNTLEQKVIERTAEISQQKEEIEAQRDQIEHQRDNLVANNKKLETAYRNIEEQKSNIEDSIHYAKRIQTAILPSSKQIHESFKDCFVLYKPKDIVSGDFYWATRKDNKDIFVVADCTGHGVPGAFMSMIGNTLLNKIVNENNITKSSEVLDNLRDEVIKSLNQKGSDHESKDGMDVVYCAFDYENMTLDFAGANNPIFLIRDGELHIYKGNKQPVGYFIAGIRPFTANEIKLQKGDQIYMFTDGYQDQFGGENDRKFMTKNFKRLLTEISGSDSSTQKEKLDNTIENWMVNSRQIDDILVVGIKIH